MSMIGGPLGVKTFRHASPAPLSCNRDPDIIGFNGGTRRRPLLDMPEKPQLPYRIARLAAKRSGDGHGWSLEAGQAVTADGSL
jgi:hypothetical protein